MRGLFGVVAAFRAGVIITLPMLLAPLVAPGALAATATVAGKEMNGFGRIVLSFDNPPKTSVRVSNGILVMSFSVPVSIGRERLAGEMPGYVSIARLDPDGKGLRLAMTKPVTANVMQAGERLFVDLLPDPWTGMKPGLPQEVVDALAQRARAAEASLAAEMRQRVKQEPTDLVFHVGSLPTLTRLVLTPPKTVPVAFTRDGSRAEVTFAAPFTIDKAKLKAALPPAVVALDARTSSKAFALVLTLTPGTQIAGFPEDDNFVLDISRPQEVEGAPPESRGKQTEASKAETTPRPSEVRADALPLPNKLAAAVTPVRAETPPDPAVSPSVSLAVAEAPKPVVASMAALAPAAPAQPVVGIAEGGATIAFPFKARTGAAAFERNGVVTLVFDGPESVDLSRLAGWAGVDGAVAVERRGAATALRFGLRQRALMRLTPDEHGWTLTLGDNAAAPSAPLTLERVVGARGRTAIEAPLADLSGVHWFDDPSGQRLAVATAFGPARGLAKPQDFVEFEALQSAHGLAVLAKADDLSISPDIDKVTIGRGGGLAVSRPAEGDGTVALGGADFVVDRNIWTGDRAGMIRDKVWRAAADAAAASQSGKQAARLAYARLLAANGLSIEAQGVLATIAGDDPQAAAGRPIALLRAVVAHELGRYDDARALLALPSVAEDPEAMLWRAALDARAEHWPQALAGFRRTVDVMESYPDDLQAMLRAQMVRAAIASDDLGLASREIDLITDLNGGTPTPEVTLLRARLDEASGRHQDALAGYDAVAEAERPVAAEALLRGTALALKSDAIDEAEARARFERLSVIWRGDTIEAETLGHLGRLYVAAGEWRQAFSTARRANEVFTDHPATQALNEEASQKFEELFLTGKGDELGKLQALALYYDFKEFTPIGRRGDEIIRRLADRLVELDLIEQAGDLLQHQVVNRLAGAARATVAAKLATLRLMNGKPAQALAVLNDTRLPELPEEVKRGRLLLEVRALSDLSRTDLALEMLAGETGPEIDRLAADVLWQARRWRQAGEAHERMLGDAWQGREALPDPARADVLRAGIAYSLAGETLSLDRLRGKYAAKMADSADARTFALLTGPGASETRTFRDIAKAAASADTLSAFLAEYRKRYPQTAVAVRPRGTRPAEPKPQGEASAAAAPQG